MVTQRPIRSVLRTSTQQRLYKVSRPLDNTDLRIIESVRANLKASQTVIARQLEIARGTVYARIERLELEGVITGYTPIVDPARAGYGVLAFTTLEIRQGSHNDTINALRSIPEIIEIHTITGEGDLLCRIVAKSNDHLHEVIQLVTGVPTVTRSQSQLALASSQTSDIVDLLVDA